MLYLHCNIKTSKVIIKTIFVMVFLRIGNSVDATIADTLKKELKNVDIIVTENVIDNVPFSVLYDKNCNIYIMRYKTDDEYYAEISNGETLKTDILAFVDSVSVSLFCSNNE